MRLKISILFIFFALHLDAENIIGFYAFPEKKYINVIKNTNFNTLITYGSELQNNENMISFLNYSLKYNKSIIFSVKDTFKTSKWYPMQNNDCDITDENKLLECTIKKYHKHKAISGWYLADEPTSTVGYRNRELLKIHASTIRFISNKPIFCEDFNLDRGKLWDEIVDSSDYLMTAIYPIPDESIYNIYKSISDLKCKYPNKKIIAVLQVFGKNQYDFLKRHGTAGRPPNINEVITMTYLAILGGADGIVYYSLKDLLSQANGRWLLNELNKHIKDFDRILGEKNKSLLRTSLKLSDNNMGYLISDLRIHKNNYKIYINLCNKSAKIKESLTLLPYGYVIRKEK